MALQNVNVDSTVLRYDAWPRLAIKWGPWSDTGGDSWTLSRMPSSDDASVSGSECQMAAAKNGSVLLNCRPSPEQDLALDGRLTAVSDTGGKSFGCIRFDHELWGADCASGFASG